MSETEQQIRICREALARIVTALAIVNAKCEARRNGKTHR